MKKRIYMLCLCALPVVGLKAQKKLSVQINTGIQMPFGGTSMKDIYSGSQADPKISFATISSTLLPVGVSVGYAINDKLNVSVGYTYSISLADVKTEVALSSSRTAKYTDAFGTFNNIHLGSSYKFAKVGSMDFYGGLNINLALTSWNTTSQVIFNGTEVSKKESKSDLSMSLGFTPKVGLIYNINDALFVDGNVNFGYYIGLQDYKINGSTAKVDNSMLLGVKVGVGYRF